jgi:putative transposase
MAAEHIPVEVACRVLDVSTSGYHPWRARPPSQRSVRHAWPGRVDRPGAPGLPRHLWCASRPCRAAAGPRDHGRPQRRCAADAPRRPGWHHRPAKWRHAKPDQIAADLVDRQFSRSGPNQLWVTDITEHPTREGKLSCAVVLDSFSRRVVGWSIDATPTAALVTNALGMAIQTRTPAGGTVIHSDQGVQFASWAFTQRAKDSGLVPSMGSVGDCYDCDDPPALPRSA